MLTRTGLPRLVIFAMAVLQHRLLPKQKQPTPPRLLSAVSSSMVISMNFTGRPPLVAKKSRSTAA